MELSEAFKHIKEENGLEDIVKSVRFDLDKLVEETINVIANPERWKQDEVG
jgi:hypothetical protein